MCAQALLAVAAARHAPALPPGQSRVPAGSPAQPAAWRDTSKLPANPGDRPPADPGMVKVSVPEARRLARLAAAPTTRAAREAGYAWSATRRAPAGTTTTPGSKQPPKPRNLLQTAERRTPCNKPGQ